MSDAEDETKVLLWKAGNAANRGVYALHRAMHPKRRAASLVKAESELRAAARILADMRQQYETNPNDAPESLARAEPHSE